MKVSGSRREGVEQRGDRAVAVNASGLNRLAAIAVKMVGNRAGAAAPPVLNHVSFEVRNGELGHRVVSSHGRRMCGG